MDTASFIRESQAEQLVESLEFQTQIGKEQFRQQLQKWTSKTGILQRRQTTILSLRESMKPELQETYESIFQEVQSLEPQLQTFFQSSPVEKDSFQQLLFSGWKSLQVLNTVPFLLMALAAFKKYVVPALAVLTPLFMIVMPYVVLKFWYAINITTDQYLKLLFNMFGLQNIHLNNPRTILQGSLTLFSVGQSIYQPIQNALHLQTIHAQLIEKANAAQRFVSCVEKLQQILPAAYKFKNPLQETEHQDVHRLFATFWDHPHILRLALQCVGDCEVVYRIANCSSATPVQFKASDAPYLCIVDGIDPFLQSAIPFRLALHGKKAHAILTGPNRGGKSSVLRTTLLTVLFAQTFGFAFTKEGSVQIKPFDWIATGLRLEDRPGTSSMFESEVEFAIQILQRARLYPKEVGFVLFDELFHSTNPPDGARTADIFLQRLWKTSNTASFISTHVFDLAKKADKSIQKLCVPAYKQQDGSIAFTYALQEGICEVSSVDLILREKGLLLTAETSTPENQKQ